MQQDNYGAAQELNKAGQASVVLGGVLGGIATGTISVMLPGISDAFSNDNNSLAIKMVATAAGLGMMIGAPLGGFLADRFGRLLVIASATLLFGAAGLAAMASTELWQLIAARLVVGITAATVSVSFVALVGDRFSPQSQGRWLGYNGAAATLVVLILIPITGALADISWRYGFLVYLLSIPCLVLAFAGVPRHLTRIATTSPQAPRPTRFQAPWGAWMLAVIVGTISMGTSLYWPFRLREIGVESARDLALYAMPNIVLIGLTGFAYGRIRRYLSVTQVFMASGLLSGVGLATIALSPTPGLVMVGLAIEGVAVGLMTPNLSLYSIGISSPENRARTVGVVKGVYYGSPFLTQFVLEAIAQRGGPSAALLAIGTTSFGLALFLGIGKARPRHHAQNELAMEAFKKIP